MKINLVIILAFLSCFFLFACGTADESTTENPEALQLEAKKLEVEAKELDQTKEEIEKTEAELEEMLEDL